MMRTLFKKTPIKAWVIKQVDDDGILHLCGQGVLESSDKPRRVQKALEAGRYQGGVRMGDTGIVLNSRRLAAVVPLHRLRLVEDGRAAEWQGRSWTVSQVPQRCWGYDGRLVTQKNPMLDSPALISTEDVSRIRQHINRDGAPPAEVVFRPVNALEDPLQDTRAAIEDVQERRKRSRKGWREDGTWGPLKETSEE
ncbi:hypothetical protein FEI13_11550 [Halomonas urmiana]|uniref:Uncharacterized protein n=1 Tax=Halomonas urmiana TaxID=490901 RepID=A0A5R8MFX2_9GAMM|nr:hypothetical protein [Halomonas urmiana]TLF49575.1 hypothetical protein FEI13_11550 [Halomonas urmiana]